MSLRRVCCKCWRCLEGCCAACCVERIVSPVLVLAVHGALVTDVMWHRPDLWNAQGMWNRSLWFLVLATVTCYLRTSLTDPGYLRPTGDAPHACLLLCCCAAPVLLADWEAARVRPHRSRRASSPTKTTAAGVRTTLANEPASPQRTVELSAAAELRGNDAEQGLMQPTTAPQVVGSQSAPTDTERLQKRRGAGGNTGDEAGAEGLTGPPTQAGVELRWCRRCHVYQPLRTKHCHDCGLCVRTHDHHCPWIGSCVGENNRVLFLWFLLLQAIELAAFFLEGVQGISVFEPSVCLVLGLLMIAMFFIMVACLLAFHTFLMLSNLTTWEHISRSRITYMKHLPPGRVSPFSRSLAWNAASYCCGPRWCPAHLRRLAGLRSDDRGGVLWEIAEQRAQCCLIHVCADMC